MKRILTVAGMAAALVWACGPKPQNIPDSFIYEVVESQNFPNLPALQSFAFGETDSCWLLLGGRTNGFHGFGNQKNFPVRRANLYAYAYNTYTHELDSLPVDSLPDPLKWQFRATNMQHVQVNDYLYMCGGYGAQIVNNDTSYVTSSVFSRVNVPQMVQAIQTANMAAFRNSVVYDQNPMMQSTGGELYKLDSSQFFLVLGHNFTGKYSDSTAQQIYLDAVRVFTITETPTSVTINTNSFRTITDSLPDSLTQFRRRDLVVAPLIYDQGNKVGVSIYGGVFTYSPGTPFNSGGGPFRWPIYVPANPNETYTLDKSYRQLSNVYSAPNLALYSKAADQMYTSIFGGLGDTNFVNQDSAAFTKFISTIVRNYGNNSTSTVYNGSTLPHYIGSEAFFVHAKGLPYYAASSPIRVVNMDSLNGRTLMGYIYGGIRSDSTQWNNVDTAGPINITRASHRVYEVYLTKGTVEPLKKK